MKIKKMLVEMVEPNSDFMRILSIRKGNLDPNDVEFDDPYISSVDKNNIYFEFSRNIDFFEYMTPYDEEDTNDIIYAYDTYDRYYEFDWYSDDEWDGGYVLSSLSDSNMIIIEEIIKFISPRLLTINERYRKMEEFSMVLKTTFDSQVTQIIEVFGESKQEAINTGVKNYTKKLVDTIFEIMNLSIEQRYGRYGYGDFEYVKMSISSLALMYSRHGNFNTPIKDVIKNHAEGKDRNFLQAPYENYYELEDLEVFQENFDLYTKPILEYMVEIIEDGEMFASDYLEIYNYINSKYEFDTPIKVETEKDDNTFLTIKSLELDGTINIEIKKDFNQIKMANVKLNTLTTLLTNYSLFDIFD